MKKFLAGFFILLVPLLPSRGVMQLLPADNGVGEPPVMGSVNISGLGVFNYQTQTEFQLIQVLAEQNNRLKTLEKSIKQASAPPAPVAVPVAAAEPVKAFADLAKAALLLARQEFPWLTDPTSPQFARFVTLSTDPAFKTLLATNPEAPLIIAARVSQEYTNHLESRLRTIEAKLADLEARLPK